MARAKFEDANITTKKKKIILQRLMKECMQDLGARVRLEV